MTLPYGPAPGLVPRNDTKAVLAVICAVADYTPTIPFVGAIAALVLARMARRDIEASGGQLTGLGMCTLASVLSWVHLVLLGLVVLAFLGLFGAGILSLPG